MFRAGYRNFGDHESLVVNQTVDAGGQIAGIRWYEIRNPGGTAPPAAGNGAANPVEIYQQQTYAPDDGNHRWMGSIAMDHNGNMALGYSISSSEMHPSIAITGRLAGDPLNEMGDENIFFAGTGSQNDGTDRWGDYSNMTVDPVDDCTFWYTQEYYQTNSGFNFKTRIASFKFPSCSIGPTGTLSGTVTDGTNPLAGVKVTAGLSQTVTDASGNYSFTLPVGTYDMTASKYGYFPASANGVAVVADQTTIQDFVLTPNVSLDRERRREGRLRRGWPLYARLTSRAEGSGTRSSTIRSAATTRCLAGGLHVSLRRDLADPGLQPLAAGRRRARSGRRARAIPRAFVQNFALTVDAGLCNRAGVHPGRSGADSLWSESFDGGVLPPGLVGDQQQLAREPAG